MRLRHLRRRLRYPFSYALLRLFLGIARSLPHAILEPLARLVGRLLWVLPGTRRLLHANLAIAFPDATLTWRRTTAIRSLQNLLLAYLDVIWYQPRLDRLRDAVQLDDAALEPLRQAQQAGTPVVILCPHLGNWEIANLAANLTGLRTAAVARKLPNPFIENYLRRLRERTGSAIIHEKGAVRGMLRALKDDRIVCLLVDQNTRPRHGGIFVNFLGLPAAMSPAPALLARRAGAALYLVACTREGSPRFRIHLEPVAPGGGTSETDEQLGQRINAITERLIRDTPEQYLWLYKRWRYIPAGAAPDPRYPWYASPLDAPARFPGNPPESS